jgi:pyruvate dehydrogenase (quinone)
MANAVPHAIGAALAHPGRQVIAMAGDGGLSMLLGELVTLKHYELTWSSPAAFARPHRAQP